MLEPLTIFTKEENDLVNTISHHVITGWERTGQMLCIVDTSLSILMTLRMCLRELCCVFTVWIKTTWYGCFIHLFFHNGYLWRRLDVAFSSLNLFFICKSPVFVIT